MIFLAYIRTQPQLRAWYVPGLITVVAAYAGSVWLLMHSLKLARTQSSGIIAAYGPAAMEDAATDPVASRPMELRSPQRALVWHDLHRARHLTFVSIGLGLIPTLIFITWIGLKGATLFIALMISAVCSWSALAGSMYPINQRAGSVLPTYLVASPIASYRIAWTRLCTSLLIQLPFLLITLAAMSVWGLAKNNRAQWMRWAHGFADMVGAEPVHGEDDVVWIGIRDVRRDRDRKRCRGFRTSLVSFVGQHERSRLARRSVRLSCRSDNLGDGDGSDQLVLSL